MAKCEVFWNFLLPSLKSRKGEYLEDKNGRRGDAMILMNTFIQAGATNL